MKRMAGLVLIAGMTGGGCATAEAPQWCCKETREYGGIVGTNVPYGHMRCMKGLLPAEKTHDPDCNCPEACWCWSTAARLAERAAK